MFHKNWDQTFLSHPFHVRGGKTCSDSLDEIGPCLPTPRFRPQSFGHFLNAFANVPDQTVWSGRWCRSASTKVGIWNAPITRQQSMSMNIDHLCCTRLRSMAAHGGQSESGDRTPAQEAYRKESASPHGIIEHGNRAWAYSPDRCIIPYNDG
jgi:hypothetical protein